jgi:CheY-like chemotaxis protein
MRRSLKVNGFVSRRRVAEKSGSSATIRVRGPVLVVDDDLAFREEIDAMLREVGIEPILLESGAHCIRFLQNQPWNWCPALVLTDIVMDGMGGYLLMRRIHEHYPNKNIPVIAVSRLNAAVDVGEAEVAGAAAYLTKPVDRDRLVETLTRVVNHDSKKGMLVFTSDYGKTRSGRRVRKS